MPQTTAAALPPRLDHPGLAGALEEAAGAVARLDQALAVHPLQAAFLYRARLEAVRRQAAADGSAIDPWHLAAMLEGLRLRMDHALHVVDRGAVFEAARTAFGLHQWITAPDFDQEGAVQAAGRHLAAGPAPGTLLGAAVQVRSWLAAGGARPAIRAALIRHWTQCRLLAAAVPLTGARAMGWEAPDGAGEGAFGAPAWEMRFLAALAAEAQDFAQLLRDLEHGWRAARARAGGRRRSSRAAAAIDALAAAPLLSATSLAGILGMSVKGATGMLDGFVAAGIVVEVTHRAKRRLFGLVGLAPLRDGTAVPRRPQPGRGPGRPRRLPEASQPPALQAPPLPALAQVEHPRIDYAVLDAAVADCEQAIRATQQALERLVPERQGR
jgi:hypothetical protein